jgi:ATP-binding cassette subfamily B protein
MNASQFMTEDTVKTTTTIWEMAKRLWPYGKKHKGLLFAAIATVFGLALVSRMIPQVIGYAIDHGFREKKEEVFFWVGLAYLGLEVFKLLFSFLHKYLFTKFGNRVLYYLREDIFSHVQNLPLNYFNKTPTGRIVTRMTNDVMNMVDLFSDTVISVFTQSIMIISILIAMTSISIQLTGLALLAAPIFIYLSHKMTKRVQYYLREQKKKLSVMNSYAAENFNGIKVIQLYNRIKRNTAKFNQHSKEYGDITMDSVKSYALLQPIFNLLTATILGSTLLFGGWMSLNHTLAIGSMVAFIMHVQDFIPPLREILEKYQQFQSSLTSAERIFALLDEPVENFDFEVKKIPKESKGEIEIKNLNFAYDKELPLVLKNINLHIQAGESIALIGRTGSGKTTLVSLLQKLYEVADGTILIDHLPIEHINKQSLRAHIGIIQQDCFIFRGTIFENINLLDEAIATSQIHFAAKVTGLSDLLLKSGRSLETQVEERGGNLSVGEKQLIAFARIIAFNPKVLILDEATANIDSEAEAIIQSAVREITKNRTSIIIAHRLSTIQHCDRVFEMRDGSLYDYDKII